MSVEKDSITPDNYADIEGHSTTKFARSRTTTSMETLRLTTEIPIAIMDKIVSMFSYN
jgi:uncharacterized membrane protein